MKCPFCRHENLKVTDSRNAAEANAIRRRRECLGCGRRFTTFEMIELSVQVLKKDGRYEDFQERKLINGLDAACRHTQISQEQLRSLAAKITADMTEQQIREISTKEIGEIVMKKLKAMDMIAYVRFACVYRRFKDVGELMEAILSATPEKSI
ncbi:transcriptional regulator NrdR [Candidatus Clavichlamydia salmonicola]|uniref:transcriptional regulator NrdR n=1 Tax=Candidatus Clavichlamydia salmonicola TaxID=469812 RepID=UPI001891DAE6|nr:transcriptional regulator NrdR [Candidatus Clavichlamydia salmonicola]